MRRVLYATIVLRLLHATAPVAWAAEVQDHSHHAKLEPSQPKAESIFNLTSTWTTQDDKQTTLSSFAGRPLVLAMIYTSCQAICPIIVSDMQVIEARLPAKARARTRFVLVTMDPQRDTPAQLGRFAKLHKLDAERWTLLTGGADDIRELAAVLGMQYRQIEGGDFAHSTLINIFDRDGILRLQQIGLREDASKSVRMVTKLAAERR